MRNPPALTIGAAFTLATGLGIAALGMALAIAIARSPDSDKSYVPNFLAAVVALLLVMPVAAGYLTCAGLLLKGGPAAKALARIGVTVATALLLIPGLASLLTHPLPWHLALLLPVCAVPLLWHPSVTRYFASLRVSG
jgi:hypothetical protein